MTMLSVWRRQKHGVGQDFSAVKHRRAPHKWMLLAIIVIVVGAIATLAVYQFLDLLHGY